MAERINFTKAALDKLIEENEGRRIVIYDTRQPGLLAELRPGGSLSFYLYRWANGRPHRLRIGAFPDITADAARQQARLLIAGLTKGEDPSALRREKREEATIKILFEHWLDSHAKQHKRTWEEDERQFKTFLAGWHNRRLSTIKKADVAALHRRIGENNGRYAANRLLALVRAMFNKATDVGYNGLNPTQGVKKFKEESRDRFLQPDELPAFFAAVKAEPNETLRDYFLLCLYTGARKMNVCAMKWEDVNLTVATWRIPTTKSGDPVTIHLSEPAVEVLTTRLASREDECEWVFPGRRSTGKIQYLSSPKFAWKRLLKRAGIKDLRLHDLRRTLGSWQAAGGASLSIIGKSLGHKSIASTAVYARLNIDPVRASVNAATTAILAAARKKPRKTRKKTNDVTVRKSPME